MAIHVENICAILNVKSLQASLDYYVNALGFKKAPWVKDDATFGYVMRDQGGIYLCQQAQGHAGTWVWIGVGDVELLFAEFQASGAKIVRGPKNYPWALEILVTDPDGHMLRFGSDPKSHRPFEEFEE